MLSARRTPFANSLAFSVICIAGGFWVPARAQEASKDTAAARLEAVSRCDAWYANVQSLRQFQVYVDISRSFVLPFSESLNESSSQMVIEADLESKKFCFYRNDVMSVFGADVTDKEYRCLKIVTYDSNRLRELRCSGGLKETASEMKDAWRHAEIPHVHAVGVANFLTARVPLDEGEITKRFSLFKDPSRDWSMSAAADGQSILRMKVPLARTIDTTVWTFDDIDLVPVTMKQTLEWAKGEPDASLPPSVKHSEAIKWTTTGEGIRVPAKILGQHRAFKDDPAGGEMKIYPVVYEVSFRWLRVNKEIEFDFAMPLTPAKGLQKIENVKARSVSKK